MNAKTPQPLRLSHKLVVTIGREGTQLLTPLMSNPSLLGYTELATLAELNSAEYFWGEKLAGQLARHIGDVETEDIKSFLQMLHNTFRLKRRPRKPRTVPIDTVSEHQQAAPLAEDAVVSLALPATLRINEALFELIDHKGELLASLLPEELCVVGRFCQPCNLSTALETTRSKLPQGISVDATHIAHVMGALDSAGLLEWHDAHALLTEQAEDPMARTNSCKAAFARQAAEQDAAEAAREAETGVVRTKVIPVAYGEAVPAALGMITAYAMAYDGGRLQDKYDFRKDWYWDDDRIPGFTERPAVYLFSNYLWSHEGCIAVSEKVKALSPGSITIHGGPDTPKYHEDSLRYFEEFPHVDIIVRGEGEATAADTLDKLQSVIGTENPDLSVLADVPGITYRHNGEIHRNPDRDRIVDLDTIPSPYLEGLFDAYMGVPHLHVTLETNRGCPYGCTFCDWGSATTSKIRKFDLERVFGEFEWCSKAKIQSVSQADANFGVFERDVAIAEKVAHLKKTTGYPEAFGGSYAKNSTKYLQKIIKVLADAGILAQGVLSLQTMDADTLKAIKRSNIKVEKYDALANEMRASDLQLSVELMMGLPGATLGGFIEDLQQCIDRDIQARVNHTTMLVNSPMNNPEYRKEHQIETGQELGPGKMPVLVSTATYTREDMDRMLAVRLVYMMCDNFGILRLVARFVRQQLGIDEMAFYQKLMETHEIPPLQIKYPILATWTSNGHHLMAPVYSWKLMMDELREFLVNEMNVPDDSALGTVLEAQLAVLPTHGRQYPARFELAHDVAAWHDAMLQAKASGHWKDWQDHVPPLIEYGPGTMEVMDTDGWVTSMLGCDIELSSSGVNWDMNSPISRANVQQDFLPAKGRDDEVEVVQVV